MPRERNSIRRICFVTGTRAEFGLMTSTLQAIKSTSGLSLQIVATGMHLNPNHGRSIDQIRAEGWRVDAVVPWDPSAISATRIAAETGRAIAELAVVFSQLEPDIVLVVGDRVEALAAATAASLSGRLVAHVHGGDRALGQVDDSLRHAITKLAHLHFPATVQSAERIEMLGEDRFRIHRVGSPGVDGIIKSAAPRVTLAKKYSVKPRSFALVVLHPTDSDDVREERRAGMVLRAVDGGGIESVIVVAPNNDPGAAGILRRWERESKRIQFYRDLPRSDFLGLLRDAAMLVGNSSSGIIEAASFGTPVIDIGDRQSGRECGENVRHVRFELEELTRAIKSIWREGRPVRFAKRNVYGNGRTGEKMARVLLKVRASDGMRRKLIAY